ncbi:DUF4286 family protein [Streptomyces mexicanus]|jgi:hypothetical protein|uniref:DUF4286 family protein n=1 Tax=Streptomyces mexicanus TaxID=178566 RepID=A0A7X1HYI2_9ACTN|nr:DUF4286 family protein [Streptomyces mexicanus]MBC2864995.1 hypothetical protein [Streptomyces mexicanus]
MGSEKAYYVVLNNPVEGEEEKFDRWTEDVHIPEVLAVDGFVAAQRYELAGPQRSAAPGPFRFMVMYEIDGDLATALANLGAAAPHMDKSVSSRPDRLAYAFVERGPRRVS